MSHVESPAPHQIDHHQVSGSGQLDSTRYNRDERGMTRGGRAVLVLVALSGVGATSALGFHHGYYETADAPAVQPSASASSSPSKHKPSSSASPSSTPKASKTPQPTLLSGSLELSRSLCVAQFKSEVSVSTHTALTVTKRSKAIAVKRTTSVAQTTAVSGTINEKICADGSKASTLTDEATPRGNTTAAGAAPVLQVQLPAAPFRVTSYFDYPAHDISFTFAKPVAKPVAPAVTSYDQQISRAIGEIDPAVPAAPQPYQQAGRLASFVYGVDAVDAKCVAAAQASPSLTPLIISGIKTAAADTYNAQHPDKKITNLNISVTATIKKGSKQQQVTDTAIPATRLVSPVHQEAATMKKLKSLDNTVEDGVRRRLSVSAAKVACQAPEPYRKTELITPAPSPAPSATAAPKFTLPTSHPTITPEGTQ